MSWSSLVLAVIQTPIRKVQIVKHLRLYLLWKQNLLWSVATVVTNSLQTQIDVEGEEVMIMGSHGEGIMWKLRDDATLLPLPYLVLNPNSHIFASWIFYPGHAVPSKTTLYVFHMFMFLLNVPNPTLLLYILMSLLNFLI